MTAAPRSIAPGALASPVEKRQNPRFRIDSPAILRVQGQPGPFLVTLLDVSVSGLRLSSPTAFQVGAKVTIKSLGVEVTGQVRYARMVEGVTFHVGVLAETISGAGDVDLVQVFRR